jgi:single-strand DNA-binding protein
MASFNKIVVVGYLGADPVMRHLPDGTAVCNFSIATTEKRKDGEVTTWFKCVAWRGQAEACGKYLAKGRQV